MGVPFYRVRVAFACSFAEGFEGLKGYAVVLFRDFAQLTYDLRRSGMRETNV